MSLAEVLVSVFLLGLAVLGMIQAYVYSVQAHREGREAKEMEAVASSVMAQTEALLRQNHQEFLNRHDRPITNWPEVAGMTYQVDEAAQSPTLKKVTVTVTYQDRHYQLWGMFRDLYR